MIKNRNYGILMPVTSLPSKEGIGTFGEGAYRFVDFLCDAKAKIWQILPLNPTGYGDSPYQSCCSNALNYYFIDIEKLVEEKLLLQEEVDETELFTDERRVNYGLQFFNKIELLRKAFLRFDKTTDEFTTFCGKGEYNDFSVFMALKRKFNYKLWSEWDEPYRTYDEKTVEKFIEENRSEYEFWQFTQFVFLKQWNALKDYAHEKGIKIMGEIPLYLSYDSVEVWKYGKKLFKVDEDRKPNFIAGVPPDCFSADGQLWGNPVYDWEEMKKDGYTWWRNRIKKSLALYDILRIDHFRGLDRYFEIPANATTARDGVWVDGPKEELFKGLDYDIVAEDLGTIDDGVLRLMKNTGFPGMRVLEFCFNDDPNNCHRPSNVTENAVCYTGTHDNKTLKQYVEELSKDEYDCFIRNLRHECKLFGFEPKEKTTKQLCSSVVELAFRCKANTVIVPMCDVLTFGKEARLNSPSTFSEENWSWRFLLTDFKKQSATYLSKLAKQTNRL